MSGVGHCFAAEMGFSQIVIGYWIVVFCIQV